MRETGVVRKDLSSEEAAPYIGFARTALGLLKNQMALGGLQQGTMTRRLPDGTVVKVQSIFGQNKISIEVPVGVAQAQTSETFTLPVSPPADEPIIIETQIPEHRFETTSLVVCGTCMSDVIPNNDTVFRPFLWRPGTAPIEVTGASSARAHAVSSSGVVVGSFKRGPNDEGAFRWTEAGGMQDLGRLPGETLTPISGATGVSDDGGVIVGSNGNQSWVWTAETGMRELPGSFTGSFKTPNVSPNGLWICGTRPVRTQTDWVSVTTIEDGHKVFTDLPAGMLWQRSGAAWTPIPLPESGYTIDHIVVSFAVLRDAWTTPIEIFPFAVNDTGAVAGTARIAVVVPFGQPPISLYDIGSYIPPPRPSGAFNSESSFTGPASIWMGGVSENGQRTVDNRSVVGGSASFVWTEGALPVPFPQVDSTVYAMAASGVHFVGASGAQGGTYHFLEKRSVPMLWTAAQTFTIPLLPGAVRGWGEGVAATNVRVPAVPPAPVPLVRGSDGELSPISSI